jgi:hypothetical protein
MKNEGQHHHRTTRIFQVKDKKKPTYRKPVAVKYLEELALEAKKTKYPSIPIPYLAKPKYRDDSANNLTRCIIDFLRLKTHLAERISSTERPIDRTETFIDILGHQKTIGRIEWIKGNGMNGSADISATIEGRSVKIGIKIRDQQSKAQIEYQKTIIAAGGLFYIARDFTSFLTWYNLQFSKP